MPRLFLDLSTTSRTTLKTGIERVAQAIFKESARLQLSDYQVVPVYLDYKDHVWQYRYAELYAKQILGGESAAGLGPIVQMHQGDILLVLDYSGEQLIAATRASLFKQLQDLGVRTHVLVYDLLPILHASFFPPGAKAHFVDWLQSARTLGSLITISQAVALQLTAYLQAPECQVQWFHLGANFEDQESARNLPSYAPDLIQAIARRPSFLCVGTIEPRKGYEQVLQAFTQLWEKGFDANLVIVGAEGWINLPSERRSLISKLVSQLRTHPQLGKRFFWFDGINDEFLRSLYRSCICLLAASYDEGFGLPLVEAARHGLPILARDIAVFQEVMGKHAQYFNAGDADQLAQAISSWYALYQQQLHPSVDGFCAYTWRQSTLELLACIGIVP